MSNHAIRWTIEKITQRRADRRFSRVTLNVSDPRLSGRERIYEEGTSNAAGMETVWRVRRTDCVIIHDSHAVAY